MLEIYNASWSRSVKGSSGVPRRDLGAPVSLRASLDVAGYLTAEGRLGV